ncbi:MAG: flagellar biosynthesis anti-sigma factor FlgM [Planctomycetota bacterium]
MADIAPLGRSFAPAPAGPSRVNGTSTTTIDAARPADQAELSDHARLLSKLADLPDVRQDVVDRVKTEIELGGYDTPERLDSAVDALLDSGDLD